MEVISNVSRRVVRAFSITSLGGSVWDRIKLLYAGLWFPLRHRLRWQGDPLQAKVTKFGESWPVYLHDESDLAIFKEVFVDEDYSIDLKINPKVIVDLGSHVGYSVILFKMRYPGAKVYAFEPDRNNFKRIEKNVSGMDKVSVYNEVISGKNEKLRFNINRRGESSSLANRRGTKTDIKLKSKTLDKILNKLELEKIDMMKFDIEGAEGRVFRNFEGINRVKNFVGEYHSDLCDINIDKFLELFDNFDTKVVEKTDGRYIISGRKINI